MTRVGYGRRSRSRGHSRRPKDRCGAGLPAEFAVRSGWCRCNRAADSRASPTKTVVKRANDRDQRRGAHVAFRTLIAQEDVADQVPVAFENHFARRPLGQTCPRLLFLPMLPTLPCWWRSRSRTGWSDCGKPRCRLLRMDGLLQVRGYCIDHQLVVKRTV